MTNLALWKRAEARAIALKKSLQEVGYTSVAVSPLHSYASEGVSQGTYAVYVFPRERFNPRGGLQGRSQRQAESQVAALEKLALIYVWPGKKIRVVRDDIGIRPILEKFGLGDVSI